MPAFSRPLLSIMNLPADDRHPEVVCPGPQKSATNSHSDSGSGSGNDSGVQPLASKEYGQLALVGPKVVSRPRLLRTQSCRLTGS